MHIIREISVKRNYNEKDNYKKKGTSIHEGNLNKV